MWSGDKPAGFCGCAESACSEFWTANQITSSHEVVQSIAMGELVVAIGSRIYRKTVVEVQPIKTVISPGNINC